MALFNQYGILFLTIFVLVGCQELPRVNESYTAIGEIIATLHEYGNLTLQVRFEENYDVEGNRASLSLTQISKHVSFLEYFDTQQTFQFEDEGCKVFTPEEWITIGSPPDIRPYETNQGNIIFPLKQLINLTSSTLRNPVGNYSNYRNIPANLFEHRITFDYEDTTTTLDIDAYWTDGSWNTSSKNNIVPLGFTIHRSTYNQTSKTTNTETQYVNIFYFAHGAVDLEAFKIREGILCEGIKESIPFPNAQNLTVFSFSTEFQYVSYQSSWSVDTWWDTKNRILRIDYDPLKQPLPFEHKQLSVSDIIAHDQGAVYRIADGKCTVIRLDNYEFDPQYIIDVRSEGVWLRPITNFFGLEESSMIYIGDAVKRGIPCSVWQGERIDWPSTERPTTTIWEWCIANGKKKKVQYENDSGFPLINLEVTVKQGPSKSSFGKDGAKMIYEFYNVKRQSPGFMDALAFDLFPCFWDNHIKLMFAVSYNSSLQDFLNTTLSNPDFFALWKAEINHAAGLAPSSLRIAQLRTAMYGKNLVVKFIFLGVHPALTSGTKRNEKSMLDAKQSLELIINSGKLTSEWMVPGKGKLYMKAVPNSLQEEETTITISTPSTITDESHETTNYISTKTDKVTKPTKTDKVTKPTKPTEPVSKITGKEETSTITDSGNTSATKEVTVTGVSYPSTQGTDKPSEQKSKPKRYSSGIMALVGIIMTFVGTAIGAFGTYYKMKLM